MKVNCRETPEGPQTFVQTVVLDGYNAPVSAGQFLDLVMRGFYDGMEVQRADGFVVQTGDPEGPADGYVDPKTGETRRYVCEYGTYETPMNISSDFTGGTLSGMHRRRRL